MTPEEAAKIIREVMYYTQKHIEDKQPELKAKLKIWNEAEELAIKALKISDCPYIKDECDACGGCEDREGISTKKDISKTQAPENSKCPTCKHLNACGRDVHMIACSEYEEKEPAVATSGIQEEQAVATSENQAVTSWEEYFTYDEIKDIHKVGAIENTTKKLEYRMQRIEETILIFARGAQMTLKKYSGAGLEDWELDDLTKKLNEIHEELYGDEEE